MRLASARGWLQARRGLRRLVKHLAHDVSSPASARVMFRAWRLGFRSSTYEMFDLDRNDPAQYLSDAAVFSQS